MSDDPYSKVTRRVWTDERFRALSAPKPNAQTLWFYLLTGPRCTSIAGLLPVGVLGIADDLNWPVQATKKCLAEIEAAGMAVVDQVAKLIWLPNAIAKHNMPANPSVVIGWVAPWKALPECALRTKAALAIREALAAEDARRTKTGKPGGLTAAFSVVVGDVTLAESGLKVGRPAGKSRQEKEHGVPDGVHQGVPGAVDQHGDDHAQQGAELQDQDQEQEQEQDPNPPQPPRSAGGAPGDGGGSGEGSGPSAPEPRAKRGRAATPAPSEPRKPRGRVLTDSQRRYADAYAAGISAASGAPFVPPTGPQEQRKFVEVLPVFALDDAGTKLTGEALDAWIQRSAEMFRRSVAHMNNFSVLRWADWLASPKGMGSPCVKARLFGGDVLRVWGSVYAKSQRGYGQYDPYPEDASDAADVAEILAAKVVSYAAENGIKGEKLHALAIANMDHWAKQYLRLDGYSGGRQYVEHKHRFASLRRNIELYGTTWAKGQETGNQGIGARPLLRNTTLQPNARPDQYDWMQEPEKRV